MPDIVYCLSARLLLGLPVADDLPRFCVCGKHIEPDHFLNCPRASKARTNRHDKIKWLLRSCFYGPGYIAEVEKPFRKEESKHRADIRTSMEEYGPLVTAIDVTVICSTSDKHLKSADAMAAAEKEKVDKYARFPEYKIVPFVMTTPGAMGPQASILLSSLCGATADASQGSFPFKTALSVERDLRYQWRAIFSVALQAGNAHVLLNGALNCKPGFMLGSLSVGPDARRFGKDHLTVPLP
jgi:hypothetical protein